MESLRVHHNWGGCFLYDGKHSVVGFSCSNDPASDYERVGSGHCFSDLWRIWKKGRARHCNQIRRVACNNVSCTPWSNNDSEIRACSQSGECVESETSSISLAASSDDYSAIVAFSCVLRPSGIELREILAAETRFTRRIVLSPLPSSMGVCGETVCPAASSRVS